MELPLEKDKILSQIKREYQKAYDYIAPKRSEWLDRYRLYTNQTRNKQLVGDTTLFTIFQTVLTKLYDDKLSVEFVPGHPDDDEKVGGLNPVAKYDYYQMRKEVVDYDWDWNTCFYGAGFLDLSEWDPKKNIINPSVVDTASFLIDPDCSYINGDARGFGKALFWGREIVKTKAEMESERYENVDSVQIKKDNSLGHDRDVASSQAQNYGAKDIYRNAEDRERAPLIEWWTTVGNERWLFVTDYAYSDIFRAKKWTMEDWPISHRKLFPIPGDPFGVSIPDLVEDKQRAKSVLTNLGLASAKADLYPMYVYDRNAISPTTDLSFGFNKWIPSDGPVNASVAPLRKDQPSQTVSYIMGLLDTAAQNATAASSMLQGNFSSQSRSANETVRVFNAGEERISVGAKIFGWSERDFWKFWLKMYQKYFTAAQKKFVRIEGAFGPKFQEVTGDMFKFSEDPDIFIESKAISKAKDQEAKQSAIAFANLAAQDASVNRRYLNKKLAQIVGEYTKDQIDRLYPPTVDEVKAEQENIKLNKNEFVPIDINEDHQTHLLIHAKADDSKSAIVHIEAHKRAMYMQREMQAQQAMATQSPLPSNPASEPLTVQQMPNAQGTGSAPAADFIGPNTVQQ
ncbi:MAG: hypothetical protein M3362_00245 [Acidobacteriota bacterium]|nr:hypothetical protein [Acidobacteriota bacterium]